MTEDLFKFRPLRAFLICIALVFAYGAMVHGFNMAGASGYAWADAPWQWRALDLLFLPLDVAIAIGLLWRKGWGVVLWTVTAYGQIMLYTLFRTWVLDVPQNFIELTGGEQTLDAVIAFHVASLLAFGGLLWWRQRSEGDA